MDKGSFPLLTQIYNLCLFSAAQILLYGNLEDKYLHNHQLAEELVFNPDDYIYEKSMFAKNKNTDEIHMRVPSGHNF